MYIKQVCGMKLLRLRQTHPGKVRKSSSFTHPKYREMSESSPSLLSVSYYQLREAAWESRNPFLKGLQENCYRQWGKGRGRGNRGVIED